MIVQQSLETTNFEAIIALDDHPESASGGRK